MSAGGIALIARAQAHGDRLAIEAAEGRFSYADLLAASARVAAGLLALPAGWIALRWHERRATLWAGTRAFLLLAGRRPVALELRARRILVEEEIDRLFERWRALQPDGGAGSRA